MPPEPMMPITLESSHERYFTPKPAQPPTPICWMMPSLMIANGSPLRVENTITMPQNVPGSMQYFSTVLPSGHSSMSDFMRIAKVSKLLDAPSMVPQRYINLGSSLGTNRS